MNKKILFSIYLVLIVFISQSQINYNDYFTTQTLRVDFYLAGNNKEQHLYWESIKKEPFWGGPVKNLIDTFNFGDYYFNVTDKNSGKLIYSRGFSSLFQEWQTTEEATQLSRSFQQTIVFPFPKNNIVLEIFCRDEKNNFSLFEKRELEIKDILLYKEQDIFADTSSLILNNPSNKAIDLVFLSEGYTRQQKSKFINDVNEFVEALFLAIPYSDHKNRFNIRTVFTASVNSGTDIPDNNVWKNTILNSSFSTFGSDRYLTTKENFLIRNYAGLMPYDQIFILVNSDKYGGGGIYNHFNIVTSGNKNSGYVFIHEFGHGFAGLADEYYSGSVAYNNYFDLTIEPWQANITTLVNFDQKWKYLIVDDIPVPTPVSKKYINKIGVYEGAGYVQKGMYRPAVNCLMMSSSAKKFCQVCREIIEETILFLTDN